MESKPQKVRTADSECSPTHRISNSMRYLLKPNATELAVKTPFWFRALLAIPEPNIQSILGFFILPTIIITGYMMAVVYVAFTIHSALVWLILGCLMSPLIIVSASTKAHTAWRYIQNVMAQHTFDFEAALVEYVALVKKKD